MNVVLQTTAVSLRHLLEGLTMNKAVEKQIGYITLTYQRGKEFDFSLVYIISQMIYGAFQGYNNLTEI